jgi:hypothetical protein
MDTILAESTSSSYKRYSFSKSKLKKQDYFIEESYEPSTQDIQAVVDFLTSHSLTIPPPQILIHAWLCGNHPHIPQLKAS